MRVYVNMVADLFHRGHLEFLKQAKDLGDYLVVGIHPDDVAKSYKREPIISFEDRKAIVEAIKYVDLVVEDCLDIRKPTLKSNLKEHHIDVVVVAFPYYNPISTTEIIKRIRR